MEFCRVLFEKSTFSRVSTRQTETAQEMCTEVWSQFEAMLTNSICTKNRKATWDCLAMERQTTPCFFSNCFSVFLFFPPQVSDRSDCLRDLAACILLEVTIQAIFLNFLSEAHNYYSLLTLKDLRNYLIIIIPCDHIKKTHYIIITLSVSFICVPIFLWRDALEDPQSR